MTVQQLIDALERVKVEHSHGAELKVCVDSGDFGFKPIIQLTIIWSRQQQQHQVELE